MTIDFTEILQKVEEIDTLAKTDWTGEDDIYKKLILIKPLCENRLNNVYADLLAQNDITQLQNQLINLISYVQTYKAGNPSYSSHIINTINAIIPIVAKFPFAGKGETSATLSKIIDDFSQKNTDIISKIKKEKEDLTEEVENLKNIVSNLSSEIEKKNIEISSWQDNFLAAQEKRSDEFSVAQRARDDDFFEAGKLYLAQFDKKEKERELEFETKENERSTNFEVQTKKLKDESDTTLNQIDNIKTKVEDIYGAIGKTSIAGAQKVYANNAKTMAHWLQGASLLLMLVAIGVLFYLLKGQLETITWSKFIYRFSIGGILLLPAFFLANEAKKQRDKENRYRELEIKMTAITPYFLEISDGASKENENLPEKDRIKLELAQKLLSPSEHQIDKNVILSPEIVDIIKCAIGYKNRS